MSGFDVAGVADSAFQAFGFAGLTARLEACDVGQFHGFIQAFWKIDRVVEKGHRGLVRKFGNVVASADVVLAQPEFPTASGDQRSEEHTSELQSLMRIS